MSARMKSRSGFTAKSGNLFQAHDVFARYPAYCQKLKRFDADYRWWRYQLLTTGGFRELLSSLSSALATSQGCQLKMRSRCSIIKYVLIKVFFFSFLLIWAFIFRKHVLINGPLTLNTWKTRTLRGVGTWANWNIKTRLEMAANHSFPSRSATQFDLTPSRFDPGQPWFWLGSTTEVDSWCANDLAQLEVLQPESDSIRLQMPFKSHWLWL